MSVATAPATSQRFLRLSDEARDRLLGIVEEEEDVFLRIEVAAGEPTGFTYRMTLRPLDALTEADELHDLDGVLCSVDTISAMLLVGSVLSYDDALNRHGFTILNPNVSFPGPRLSDWRFLSKVTIDRGGADA